MPRDGSGNYSLPAGNPVVTGTAISSTTNNTTMSDVGSALTGSVPRDGTGAMTGNLQLGSNAITGVTAITATGTVSAGGINVTAATVPANGWYLSAANTVSAATNSTLRASINATGNVTVAAASSGTQSLLVNAVTANYGIVVQASAAAVAFIGMAGNANSAGTTDFVIGQGAASQATIINRANASLSFGTNGNTYLSISSTGQISNIAPTSGAALTISGVTPAGISNRTVSITHANAGDARLGIATSTAGDAVLNLDTTGVQNWTIANQRSSGNLLLGSSQDPNSAPKLTLGASGVSATVTGSNGTHSTKIADSATNSFNAGFLEVPQNIQNVAYAPVLSDSGKHIYHSDGTARTYTIPANGTVAYPIGTTLTFVNDASGAVNVTIAITTDTLYWAVDGTAGPRTLARYGIATALKVTATRWTISGTGLT